MTVSSVSESRLSASSVRRVLAEAAVVLAGAGLVLLAIGANQAWLDRHILPSFFLMRRWYVFLESSVRIAMAMAGVGLVLGLRRRAGRVAARRPAGVVAALLAVVLAIGAGAVVLAWRHPSTQWLLAGVEPLRRPDPLLGWTFVPSRTGRKTVSGRVIQFAFDADGHRVRGLDDPVNPARPTIVFSGESVMVGEGLTWSETIPAQVGAMLGVQSANLAVHGYATDQSYMRLKAELPRFQRPVAVVSLFMTALFGRNLDDDRPHLGPGLIWRPAVEHSRIFSLAKLIVPFRRDVTVERGLTITREVLRATSALATARGATALIVVPQFNREDAAERMLRRRILGEAGLPYVFVEFAGDWRLSGDVHPNASTAHEIAVAIANRLREQLSTVAAQSQ